MTGIYAFAVITVMADMELVRYLSVIKLKGYAVSWMAFVVSAEYSVTCAL
jgi:uncharacterized membrane protein (DUF485 family)